MTVVFIGYHARACTPDAIIDHTSSGNVVDFAINEKCAAGTGAFTEAMARALEVPIEELGPLSLKSTQAIPMNAQCAVFAESEVVSMIHNNIPKPDMARSVHDAIAKVFDGGTTERGQPWFAMELVEGPSLRIILAKKKRLEPEEAVSILWETADALAHRAAAPGTRWSSSGGPHSS